MHHTKRLDCTYITKHWYMCLCLSPSFLLNFSRLILISLSVNLIAWPDLFVWFCVSRSRFVFYGVSKNIIMHHTKRQDCTYITKHECSLFFFRFILITIYKDHIFAQIMHFLIFIMYQCHGSLSFDLFELYRIQRIISHVVLHTIRCVKSNVKVEGFG